MMMMSKQCKKTNQYCYQYCDAKFETVNQHLVQ